MHTDKEFIQRFIIMGLFILVVMGAYTNYKKTGTIIPFAPTSDDTTTGKVGISIQEQTETKNRMQQYVLYLAEMERELKALESTVSVNLTQDLELEKLYLNTLDSK
jgi:hypothetical protein